MQSQIIKAKKEQGAISEPPLNKGTMRILFGGFFICLRKNFRDEHILKPAQFKVRVQEGKVRWRIIILGVFGSRLWSCIEDEVEDRNAFSLRWQMGTYLDMFIHVLTL